MAIVISGVNNNDKITASDGTIDLLSGVNYTGIITAPAITSTGNITAASINVGSNIQLGNAGIVTATTFTGNLTGNVNNTMALLLQIGGSEKFRVGSSGQFGIGGANYGTSGQVLTSGGSGSAATWSTITGTTINNNADNRVITGSGTANTLEGEANLTFDGTNLRLGTTTAAIGGGTGIMVASSTGARIKLCDSDAGVTANDGFEIIAGNGGTGYINNKENQSIVISTNNTERMRVTHEGSVGIGTDNSTYELEVHDGTGAAALRMKDGANNVICDLIANSTGGLLRTVYNHPLVFHTNQVERMRISNNGVVTMPNQPSFEASYPDGYDSSNSPSHHITTWLRVHHNIGSHFNGNNGRFTAPVDGRYLVSVHMTNVGHASPHIAFTINDGTYAAGPSRSGTDYTETWHISEGSGGGVNLTHIFDLSANDYVRASTWNYTGTGDDPRCYFCGYLLG